MRDEKFVKCRRVHVSNAGTIEIPGDDPDLNFRLIATMYLGSDAEDATCVPTVVPIQEFDELEGWQCLVAFHGLSCHTMRYLVDANRDEIFYIFQYFISQNRKVSAGEITAWPGYRPDDKGISGVVPPSLF